MSEQQNGQTHDETAPSVPQNANTGTSDAERIAALEAELAEARGLLADSRSTFDSCSCQHEGTCTHCRAVDAYLTRPAGTAAARVIDPEQDGLAFHKALSRYASESTRHPLMSVYFWRAALAYERSRS